MLLSTTYRSLTASLMTVAEEVCGGRIVMTHEGGYSAAIRLAEELLEELPLT